MEKKVTTITGRLENKSDCRKMKGIYYFKGDYKVEDSGECYLINDRYYKYNTGYIIYDHRIKEYVLKSQAVADGYVEKGVVGFNNSTIIFGAFTLGDKLESELITLVYKDNYYTVLSEDVINHKIYKENLANGMFYDRQDLPASSFVFPDLCDPSIKNKLPYDSRGILKSYIEKYNERYKPVYCDILKTFNKKEKDLTKGLSFGLEFETTEGYIPSRITDNLGLIPLKDGSVKGLEYVTIPLEGNKGLQTVLDSLKQLKKRTSYDRNCSLHLHIGNIPRTEEFFLAAFKMLFYLQNNMFKLFPFHKKENYGIKRKAYTKPLPLEKILLMDNKINKSNIKDNFDILYQFLSAGQPYSEVDKDLSNVKSHPSDPGATSKWNIKSRYYWVNLIPLLFGNKQTIEFRIHTPTVDPNKVMNYMLLCFSIVDFIKKYQNDILKDSTKFINENLCSIFTKGYHTFGRGFNLTTEFLSYHDYRKQHFFRKTAEGDLIADEDEFTFRKSLDWYKIKKDSSINEELDAIINTYKKANSINQVEAVINNMAHGNVPMPNPPQDEDGPFMFNPPIQIDE